MRFVNHKERSSWLKDVTWDEIREAERFGEEEMEFELMDIEEEAHSLGWELDNLIINNIKYILNREGLFDPTWSIGMPQTSEGLYWECDQGICYYTANFGIYDERGNLIARGVAHGHMLPTGENSMVLQDMTVELPTEDVKKLKSLTERVKTLVHTIFK